MVGPEPTEGPIAQRSQVGELEPPEALELGLRASEERYRSVVAAMEEGIVLQGADGTIQAWNASAERILGLTGDQLLGRLSADFRAVHEDGSPFLAAEHPAMVTLRTGEPHSNVIMGVHRPDGCLVWISINTQPLVRPGGRTPYAVVASFTDITERRHARNELERLLGEEQEARKRAAFLAEAGEVLAGSLDIPTTLEAVVRLMVPRLGEFATIDLLDAAGELGPDRLFAVAATDLEQERLYREASKRFPLRSSNPFAEVLRSGRPYLFTSGHDMAPLRAAMATGAEHLAILERLWHRSGVLAPLTARGQLLGMLALGVSRREPGPDDLSLVVELGRRAALAIDNARLYQQSQEAIRVRDEFLAIAAHELRTPLTSALLNLHRLLRLEQRSASQPPRLADIFHMVRGINRQVDRLHRLVEELLDISRITGGQLRLELEPVDLGGLVAEIVERASEDLRRARCTIALDAPTGVVGSWDRLRLDQVVTNLLTNAMKYGAGEPIRISIAADGATARLAVQDHGIGIAPRDQERIFQRFERAVSTQHYGGFGLGLWITRQIVEAMGGTIRVNSALGHGSTFAVELPRGAGPGAARS